MPEQSRKTFSYIYTDKLGDEIKSRAQTQCPDGLEFSTRSDDEYAVVAAAWNEGIDAYLEAITSQSSVKYEHDLMGTRAFFKIHPDEVHVLVRRLLAQEPLPDEDTEKENPAAESLASALCDCLGIELI